MLFIKFHLVLPHPFQVEESYLLQLVLLAFMMLPDIFRSEMALWLQPRNIVFAYAFLFTSISERNTNLALAQLL